MGKQKKELKIFSMKLGLKQDYLLYFLEFKTEFINNLKLFDFSRWSIYLKTTSVLGLGLYD